jgi:F0F1-type ATP synthase assembly protein I
MSMTNLEPPGKLTQRTPQNVLSDLFVTQLEREQLDSKGLAQIQEQLFDHKKRSLELEQQSLELEQQRQDKKHKNILFYFRLGVIISALAIGTTLTYQGKDPGSLILSSALAAGLGAGTSSVVKKALKSQETGKEK